MSACKPPQPWFKDGLKFTCTQCGNCCTGAPGFVWVNDEEIAAIAAQLDLSEREFRSRHTRRVDRRRSLLERRNGDCEFLARKPDGRTACTIHGVRPVQCRTWPFWGSSLATTEDWDEAAKTCPGMNHGEHHSLAVIHVALTRNGNLPL